MANELYIRYNGSATIYAIIRRKSDAYVWNGSGFASWADGSIASYDIALTSQGGDLYAADFPSTISAGTYLVDFYIQAGGSPATTDQRLPNGKEYSWNGAAITEGNGTVSVSAYALTTLTSVKTLLGITSTTYDDILATFINRASATIEQITDRRFAARNYRKRYTGTLQRRLVLNDFPVQRVTRISLGAGLALSVKHSGSGIIRATASVYSNPESPDGGGILLNTIATDGTPTETTIDFATYKTTQAAATQINTVSGWTATALTNWPTKDLNPAAVNDALAATQTFTYPDVDLYNYTVDHQRGLIEFERRGLDSWFRPYANVNNPLRFPSGIQAILVEYRAGFETIPEDVAQLCFELVKSLYYSRKNDGNKVSESIGPYSATFREDQLAMIKSRMSQYMNSTSFIGST